jgi:hypothetical protein
MAQDYKILGQSNPNATTETTLYTVPAGKQAVISTLVACNQAGTAATFRIAVRPAADSVTAAKHWIAYGSTVAASDSTILTIGLTLSAGDKIQVYGSTANISFSAFGTEIA